MEYRIGDIIEDMIVTEETKIKTLSRGKEFWSKRIVCTCRVCGREKLFQPSALNRLVGTSHRMCNHSETERIRSEYPEFYRCWSHIKARINNPNIDHFERYGGRGLTNDYEYFVDFCDDLFESYLEHVKIHGLKDATIERKNNDLGYVKGNIVWATWKQQAVNRCTTVNYEITDVLTGQSYRTNNLKAFCDEHEINHKAFHVAIQRGQILYNSRWKATKL